MDRELLVEIIGWAVLLAIVLIAIATRRRLRREQYLRRMIGWFVALALAAYLSGHDETAELIAALFAVALYFLIFRWTTMRFNDVGFSRWMFVTWIVPLTAIVAVVQLCFRDSAPGPQDRKIEA